MLYKEISVGFLLAGFIGLLGNDFFNGVLVGHAASLPRLLENAIVGPIVAVLSFVCSIGNVPLAAVLWSGGISFGGVVAFLFADLIVLPIVVAYRKYYGTRFALRITALMFVAMVLTALIIDGSFSALGLIPSGARPTRADIFGSVRVDYKLFLDIAGLAVFAALFALTMRRGVSDPVCGMTVDRAKAFHTEIGATSHFFCSERCRSDFEANPERYASAAAARRRARGNSTQRHADASR
jgi:YHS domain-containing protein